MWGSSSFALTLSHQLESVAHRGSLPAKEPVMDSEVQVEPKLEGQKLRIPVEGNSVSNQWRVVGGNSSFLTT